MAKSPGADVSFSVVRSFNDNTFTNNYSGTIADGTIKGKIEFTRNGEAQQPRLGSEKAGRNAVTRPEGGDFADFPATATAPEWTTFAFYAFWCVGQLIWALTTMLETEGFSLEQIQRKQAIE